MQEKAIEGIKMPYFFPYACFRYSKYALSSILLLGSLCLSLAGCQQLSGIGKNSFPSFPPLDTATLSSDHEHVLASYGGIYENPGAEREIAQIAGKLLAVSTWPDGHYRITLLNSPRINAFALPGGYLYVTRGLLSLANNGAEIAAVLAHEIAHIVANHASARMSRAQLSALSDRVLTEIIVAPDQVKRMQQASRAAFARFSRAQELEADRIGIKMLAQAGYDPHSAAQFLTKLQSYSDYMAGQSEKPADNFFSSHPGTPERRILAQREARRYAAPSRSPHSDSYLENIDGLLFGDDPQSGYVRGRSYRHGGLGIGFDVPRGLRMQTGPGAVYAWAGQKVALRFDIADLASFESLEDYIKSGWIEGLLPDSLTLATVNGLQAARIIGRIPGWVFHVAVVRIGQSGYRFILASNEDGAEIGKQFHTILSSFRILGAAERQQLTPLRIKVITIDAGAIYENIAAKMSGVEPAERLRFFKIINGIDAPSRRSEEKRKVKLVVAG